MNRKGRTSSRQVDSRNRDAAPQSATIEARWWPLWSVVILAVGILAVYAQTLDHRFSTWDDPINVAENPHLNPATWESVARFWREPYANLYVPLTYTFWSAEAWLAETPATPQVPRHLSPWIFHAGNLLLHFVSVLGVWQILRLIVRTELPALAGALFYALHPLLVESVAWVTETKGLLAGALGWFAIWQHLLAVEPHAESNSPTGEGPRPFAGRAIARHSVAAVAFALALLAKPSAVSLPAMALVLDVLFLRVAVRRSLLSLAPWFLLAIGSVVTTWWQQSGESLHFVPPPLWQRPFIAGDSLAFYLWKTVWPFGLGIDHGRSPTAVFASGIAYGAWLVPVALAVAIYWTRERTAWWGALALFVLGILPVSGLIPFSYQDISTVADRYAYLAMLGPALAVAWFLTSHRGAGWYLAFSCLAVLCAATSAWQASRWRDDQTLYAHSIDVNPTSYISHTLLGRTLQLQQKADVKRARDNFLAAIAIAPERPRAYCDLGLLEHRLGRHDESLQQYQRAIEADPQFAEAHLGVGLALAALERHTEAIVAYRRGLELEPQYAPGWLNLALSLRDAGQTQAAIDALRRARELAPQFTAARIELVRLLIITNQADEVIAEFQRELATAEDKALVHYRFAVALTELARYEEALAEVDRAIELAPLDLTPRNHRAAILLRQGNVQAAIEQWRWIDARKPASPAALDLAWTLATQPEAQWRDGPEAVRLATAYCVHTRYADARGVDVLAAAYAEVGNYPQAVEMAEHALDAARKRKQLELAREIEQRLALYRQEQPYRTGAEDETTRGEVRE